MILICIDHITDILNFGNGEPELTYGKEYEVTRLFDKKEDGRQFIGIINDSNKQSEYLITRFVTKEVYRDNKLKELGI